MGEGTMQAPETVEHTALGDYIHQISPLRSQETSKKRRQKGYKTQTGWRVPVGQCCLNHLSKSNVNSQRLMEQAQGLHRSTPGPLCIHDSFQFSIFMGFLSVWMNGSLILVPALETFPPSVGLPCPASMWRVLLYLIVLFKKKETPSQQEIKKN